MSGDCGIRAYGEIRFQRYHASDIEYNYFLFRATYCIPERAFTAVIQVSYVYYISAATTCDVPAVAFGTGERRCFVLRKSCCCA